MKILFLFAYEAYLGALFVVQRAAERGFIDDIISPRDTRRRLARDLELLRTKKREEPKKKHGNIPL